MYVETINGYFPLSMPGREVRGVTRAQRELGSGRRGRRPAASRPHSPLPTVRLASIPRTAAPPLALIHLLPLLLHP